MRNNQPFTLLAVLGSLVLASAPLKAAPDAETMKLGQQTFALCMACHGVDGKGLPVGNLKMAPPIAGSPYILGDKELLTKIVLKGIAKEDAKFVGIMAPLEAALDDKKVAAVLTYVRNSFGNKADPVTEAEAKAARAKFKGVKGPLKRADLEKELEANAKAKK